MKHYEKITMPFGMIGSIIYLIHTLLGRILWTEYNPVGMANKWSTEQRIMLWGDNNVDF